MSTPAFTSTQRPVKSKTTVWPNVAFYVANPGLLDDEDAFWAIEAGIEKKWFPLGKTTIYGQYYDYDGGSLCRSHQLR